MIRARFLAGWQRLRTVWRDTTAIAMVELAFISPIMLLMGVAGIEMANLAVTHLRISQAASHIADNASRIGDRDGLTEMKIYEGDINDLFIGVRIQTGLDLYNDGRVILSSLQRNDDDGQWIAWQRCMGIPDIESAYGEQGEGETGTDFDGMGEAGSEVTATEGQAVMYVEIEYEYTPLMDNGFTRPFLPTENIRSESTFYVRGSRDLDRVYQRSTPSTVYTCDKNEAI